ncbi:MAG: hypothetical protein ACQESK_06755 [Bacteroidota bacterium]
MKKTTFNIIVIALFTILLLALSQFDLLDKSAKFMLLPILAAYFIGQYAERKFK